MSSPAADVPNPAASAVLVPVTAAPAVVIAEVPQSAPVPVPTPAVKTVPIPDAPVPTPTVVEVVQPPVKVISESVETQKTFFCFRRPKIVGPIKDKLIIKGKEVKAKGVILRESLRSRRVTEIDSVTPAPSIAVIEPAPVPATGPSGGSH